MFTHRDIDNQHLVKEKARTEIQAISWPVYRPFLFSLVAVSRLFPSAEPNDDVIDLIFPVVVRSSVGSRWASDEGLFYSFMCCCQDEIRHVVYQHGYGEI